MSNAGEATKLDEFLKCLYGDEKVSVMVTMFNNPDKIRITSPGVEVSLAATAAQFTSSSGVVHFTKGTMALEYNAGAIESFKIIFEGMAEKAAPVEKPRSSPRGTGSAKSRLGTFLG